MKNVRLFAVAAAMGMFASTVAAAEVSKETYVATWGEVDEIVKVDVGDKVVAPTATIKVVKETRTTDSEYASTTTTDSLGISSTDSVCYAGWTNTEGKDTNGDGWVDTKILTSANVQTAGWLYTPNKFWPTAKTSTYYVGLGKGGVTGGRFLAPGAEKQDVYALALAHKHLANEEEVLAYFEEKGVLKFEYDENGYIKHVDINPTQVKNNKGKVLGTASIRVTAKDHKYADSEIKADIVETLIAGGTLTADTDYYTTAYVASKNYTDAAVLKYYYTVDGNPNPVEITKGKILVVKENKYGDLELDTTPVVDDNSLLMANSQPIVPDPNKIIVALQTGTNEYSKYMTIDPAKAAAWTAEAGMYWSSEAGSFVKVEDGATAVKFGAGLSGYYWNNEYDAENDPGVKTITTAELDLPDHTLGLYHLVTPANPSDKIVIYTGAVDGVADGVVNLSITGINTKNGTMTVGYGTEGKELTVSAVKIGNAWYPAVNTEEEVVKFVEKVLGLTTLAGDTTKNDDADDGTTPVDNDSAFDAWVNTPVTGLVAEAKNPISGVTLPSRTNAEGNKETYVPQNALQHYKATFCTYKLEEGAEVTPVITSNAASIDTTTAGVKTLTLTAKVGEEVVGTKDVKVVVAPKYERVYQGGKVVKLTAKWLNGNTYAVYSYDWAKKTYTATFYAQDGVTVVDSANGTL